MSFDMIYSVLARRNLSPKDLIFNRRVGAVNKKNETSGAESHDDDEKETSFKHEFHQHLKGHIDESV